jgi:hypothetical protein
MSFEHKDHPHQERIDRKAVEQYVEGVLSPDEPRIAEPMDPRCDVAVVIPSCGERELFFSSD